MPPPIFSARTPGGLLVGNAPGGALSIDWQPSPAIVAAGYVKLGLDIRSFREPLKRAVQKVVAPSIGQNFDVEGRPAWTPLSEATMDIRAREGFSGGPILTRKGSLKRVSQQLNIWTIDQEKAAIFDLPEKVWYGKVHQGGGSFTPRGGSSARAMTRVDVSESTLRRIAARRAARPTSSGAISIPARPFLLIQPEDVDQIEDVFAGWVRERAALAGFRPGIG